MHGSRTLWPYQKDHILFVMQCLPLSLITHPQTSTPEAWYLRLGALLDTGVNSKYMRGAIFPLFMYVYVHSVFSSVLSFQKKPSSLGYGKDPQAFYASSSVSEYPSTIAPLKVSFGCRQSSLPQRYGSSIPYARFKIYLGKTWFSAGTECTTVAGSEPQV